MQNKTVKLQNPVLRERVSVKDFILALNITRYTCDSSGTVLNDAAVPVDQRKAYPFHLFNEFDHRGGYSICDSIVQSQYRTNLFTVYVVGVGTPLFYFSPAATINSFLKKGDVVFVYVDDILAPSYFHFVVISATQGGYASLLALTHTTQIDENLMYGNYRFDGFDYSWSNDQQLKYPIIPIQTRFDSSYRQQSPFNPIAFDSPYQRDTVKVRTIDIEMLINQYIGLTHFIAWENPLLTLSFKMFF